MSKLSYDQYRMLRFNKADALWHGTKIPYQVEFNHRGFIYTGRIDVNEVVDGRSQPVRYAPDMFEFGKVQRPTNEDLGFAGFRLHGAPQPPGLFRRSLQLPRRQLLPRRREGPHLRPLRPRPCHQDRRPGRRGIPLFPHLLDRAPQARASPGADHPPRPPGEPKLHRCLPLHHHARASTRLSTPK